MFDSRVEIIEEIRWPKKDSEEVYIKFEEGSCWQGAKRKDFWNPDNDWEKQIVKGSSLRLWSVQYSIIVGFEWFSVKENKWISVWCHANNFETKKEREKSMDRYVNFIKDEGKRIAKMIDAKKTFEQIDKSTHGRDHTGNTFGMAMNIAIHSAKNKENAEKVRITFNKGYGVLETEKGVVNPAILTVKTDD